LTSLGTFLENPDVIALKVPLPLRHLDPI